MTMALGLELETLCFYTFTAVLITSAFLVWLGVRFDKEQQRKSTIGIQDEPPQEKPLFENLHNFRQAGGISLRNRFGRKVRDGMIFRSSRTDFLTREETEQFFQLGIKCIIDLRRNEEYVRADGPKILDSAYKPCIVKKGKVKDWKARKRVSSKAQTSSGEDQDYRGKRYLVNLMTIDLIKNVFFRVNFLVRYSSLVLLAVDWLFSCHLFVRLFSHLVSNHETLAEQYTNMLEHTKPVVADIMRLLLDEENAPVLIHCAHGKDRTGVIVALILGCLEVEDEVIACDYSLSEAGLAPMRKRLFRETVGRYGFKKEFANATVDTMRETLAILTRKYGGIHGYLSEAGFTEDEQQALKDKFLE